MENRKTVHPYYIWFLEGLIELVSVALLVGTVLFIVGKPEMLAAHNIIFGGPMLLAWIVLTLGYTIESGGGFGWTTQLIQMAPLVAVGLAIHALACGIDWVGRKTKMNKGSRATAVVEDK